MLPFWLLPVALAGTPAAPQDDGVAAAVGVRVEMSPVFVRGGVIDKGVWGRIPDPSGLEVALAQFNVAVEDAAVIQVAVVEEERHTAYRIDRVDLGEGSVQEMAGGRRGQICTPVTRGGIWNGGNEIRVFPASRDNEARVRDVPAMIMIEDHPYIGAMVALSPGDVVTVRDVRRRGVLMRETVTVERPSGDLVVERDELRERVCFEAPEER